jgi:uncharacterized protein involved in response to NO
MMSDSKSRRIYAGPAMLSYGFRPFFLAGALWAIVSVMLWMPQYFGELTLNMAFQPLEWHAHEALFGYVAAIVTGFLLTAVPNWTGRLPLNGLPLLLLLVVWLAGRAAVAFSAHIGWVAAAIVDCAFLALVCAAVAREIMAGKNWRNLKVLIFVGLLLAANVVFHLEAHFAGSAPYGRRFGVAATIALVMLIGGRVIPSFTHTFLQRRGARRLPTAFNRFDGFCLGVSVTALGGWVLAPDSKIVGLLLIAAGLLNLFRLARWAGDRTSGEALVLILHLAYLFVPIGFVLSGLAAWTGIPLSAGLHAWAVGAIGVMTMAVITPFEPRPHRPGLARGQGRSGDLRLPVIGRRRPHRRGLGAAMEFCPAASRRFRLGLCLSWFRHGFWRRAASPAQILTFQSSRWL